jgi:hypothetical protein
MDMDTNSTVENLREASGGQLSDDQLDLVAGGIGNVIANS